MRLLVACQKCKRQYDASGKPLGGRFRCQCGLVVTIRQPHGHDAAVVRCSSCGAPRSDGSPSCLYCSADFTLHEQDLDTVCPQCLARVSDRAKYCHHCGIALLPEPLASGKSSLSCPACGKQSRLHHRQIGELALLECDRCAGFWVAGKLFENLVERVSRDPGSQDWRLPMNNRRIGAGSRKRQRGPIYRKCPVCARLMTRRNYARRSGVIIDFCAKHGVWFDADELAQILAWVRSGSLAQAKKQQADEAGRKQRLDKIDRLGEQQREVIQNYSGRGYGGVFDVLSVFGDIFF